MIKYILKKNNVEGSHSFGKWYAFPVKESTVDIDKLAEHMAAHNTPYSAGAIKGIITDMVSCIKELLLEGRSVKLPLTSSLRHPKIFVKEFSDFLMSCHQHCLGVNLLVQR